MSRTDLIADALTIVRNAIRSGKEEVIIPCSKVLIGIVHIFKEEGYIDEYKEIDIGRIKKIKVYLKYKGKEPSIKGLTKVSLSSRRVYADKTTIPVVRAGFGVAILSTSRGIISNKEAKKIGVGGEVICYVW